MGVPDDAKVSPFPSQSLNAGPKPVICLVALSLEMNPSFYENVLLPAIRDVLEQEPYFWRVVYSHDKMQDEIPWHNITKWMEQAKIFIIEVSEQHPDTYIALGRIYENQKQKGANAPIIVLSKHNVGSKMSLPDGVMRISYTVYRTGKHSIDDLAVEFSGAIEGRENIQKLRVTSEASYLSPLVLINILKIEEKAAHSLSKRYVTMENFVHVRPDQIARLIRVPIDMAKSYQRVINDLLHDIQNQ